MKIHTKVQVSSHKHYLVRPVQRCKYDQKHYLLLQVASYANATQLIPDRSRSCLVECGESLNRVTVNSFRKTLALNH